MTDPLTEAQQAELKGLANRTAQMGMADRRGAVDYQVVPLPGPEGGEDIQRGVTFVIGRVERGALPKWEELPAELAKHGLGEAETGEARHESGETVRVWVVDGGGTGVAVKLHKWWTAS